MEKKIYEKKINEEKAKWIQSFFWSFLFVDIILRSICKRNIVFLDRVLISAIQMCVVYGTTISKKLSYITSMIKQERILIQSSFRICGENCTARDEYRTKAG